jgi:hypothetical protein
MGQGDAFAGTGALRLVEAQDDQSIVKSQNRRIQPLALPRTDLPSLSHPHDRRCDTVWKTLVAYPRHQPMKTAR